MTTYNTNYFNRNTFLVCDDLPLVIAFKSNNTIHY